MKKTVQKIGFAVLALGATVVGASAQTSNAAVDAIETAGATVAGYAATAGAAGVAVFVIIWGIRAAKKGARAAS